MYTCIHAYIFFIMTNKCHTFIYDTPLNVCNIDTKGQT